MTAKRIKTKRKPAPGRARKIADLHGSGEESPFRAGDDKASQEDRWNRPRRQRICLRVDVEVVDWFKSQGAGYQTQMNRVLRKAMTERKMTDAKKRR
jgi:uncharacterized protein (DUF4415 family)